MLWSIHGIKKIQRIWKSILDVILPPQARTARTQARRLSDIPLTLAAHELLKYTITTLMDYQKPAVQDLIRALKYERSEYAAHLCAQIVTDYLREELASMRTFTPRPILLIPLPLHASRKKERGFNQIEVVLARLPTEFRDGTLASYLPDALVRTKATKQQAHLSRAERIKNVRNAFEIVDPAHIKRAIVYLIDDVTTTGATLVSAGKVLEHAGVEVHLMALARA
jgi:ComF family protein